MATSHLRSACSSSMPEAAGSSTMPPEPPAEQAAAIDHRVDGSRGRHQVTTLPSSSSVEPPLTTPSVAILSAHHVPHDSQSTGCMECKDIRDHFQVFGTTPLSRRTSCRLRFGWWGGPNISRRVAASTSGGASRQYSWMQHPSLPRRSAQIDPRRIPEGPVAHGLSRTSRGGPTRKNE